MIETLTSAKPSVRSKPRISRPRRWNVILLDDDDHTYEYVIRMLMEVFGQSVQRAYRCACEVDRSGRVICMTTHRELAELKLEQIIGYGPDQLIASCAGPMSAIIEPVDDGDDD